jgi:hypothetical protein
MKSNKRTKQTNKQKKCFSCFSCFSFLFVANQEQFGRQELNQAEGLKLKTP